MSDKRKKQEDTLENRMSFENHRSKISDAKLSMGSTKNKYPIFLDDGKTIIFIKDKSKEAEIIERYKAKKKSNFNPNF
jgi:flagellar biosynthesis component FlhA